MSNDGEPYFSLPVHFNDRANLNIFGRLLGQTITKTTRSLWYPSAVKGEIIAVHDVTKDDPDEAATPDLFGTGEPDHWGGMPELNQRDLSPVETLEVHFRNERDRNAFAQLIGQTVTDHTRSLWYPKAQIDRYVDKRWTSAPVVPRYPVYVISKGRWDSRLTSKALERDKIPYHIVVEPLEYREYAAVIDRAKILVLPFSNLGQGSIPARNWVWEHAIKTGAARHWILDDNIDGFYRLNHNLKVEVESGATFRAAEDFSDRYENVAESGFNYFMLASRKTVIPAYTLNTRIYSAILLRNDLTHRWRGRYNEDTDLSLRILKDGLCTVLFNAFLAYKMPTMTMTGGNTEALYRDDGRKQMAESLREQHPDLVRVVWKWGRWQHHVDYSGFRKNRLKLKAGVVIPSTPDNYGMTIRMLDGSAPPEGMV